MSDEMTRFKYNLKFSPPLHEDNYISLEKWRIILYRMGVIGESKSDQVNFGALSHRVLVDQNQFIISGAQTGEYANLDGSQYTRVLKCDLRKKLIEASGPIAPATISHIHHLLYKTCPQINFLFHLRHESLSEYLSKKEDTRLDDPFDRDFESAEISITSTIGQNPSGVFALTEMPGELISFGPTAEIAGKLFLDTLKESKN